MRAKILEEGYTGEYWYEAAGFRTDLSKRDCSRVLDILQAFRITTYSQRPRERGDARRREPAHQLDFRGFDHIDALQGHIASYVEFLMRDRERWTQLQPQLERNDRGNSHMPMLDTYLRMLSESRRIMDSRKRGLRRLDLFLSLEKPERIAHARVH